VKELSLQGYADQLVEEKALSASHRSLLLENRDFFESHREYIKSNFRLQWVATFDRKIVACPTLPELTRKIGLKNGPKAYIEKVL